MGQFVDDIGRMPDKLPLELGWPEEIGGTTRTEVANALQRKNPIAKKVTFEVTLKSYLEGLKKEKDPTAKEKARRVETELLFLARYFKVDTSKIFLRKLPGNAIGKEEGGKQFLDTALFSNKAFTADQFTDLRREALAHELTHSKFDLDDEKLTGLYSAIITEANLKNHEEDLHNIAVVANILGDGDSEKGCLRAIELYTASEYEALCNEFCTAYLEKYPTLNEDDAERVFQLAFPSLVFDGEGKMEPDREAIEKFASKKAKGRSTSASLNTP